MAIPTKILQISNFKKLTSPNFQIGQQRQKPALYTLFSPMSIHKPANAEQSTEFEGTKIANAKKSSGKESNNPLCYFTALSCAPQMKKRSNGGERAKRRKRKHVF